MTNSIYNAIIEAKEFLYMTITKVLKVLGIVLMTILLLVLASWCSSLWASAVSGLGLALPAEGAKEPIATALRGWLPTVRSAGAVIVLLIACILGWGYGKKIWEL